MPCQVCYLFLEAEQVLLAVCQMRCWRVIFNLIHGLDGGSAWYGHWFDVTARSQMLCEGSPVISLTRMQDVRHACELKLMRDVNLITAF